MRLRRLEIENWRGVGARRIEFDDGVTLIAGPNEIGKSSLVEALRLLFNELDSSKKQAVKAVQPVGVDVGSRVEAEVEIGDYRFVYAKTYNKSRATTLDISAPAARQMSGREAHQEVTRILAEQVDMDLWEALLVDQGRKVGRVQLRRSQGLARALDEAAGSASAGDDDGSVFRLVEEEYERYYTRKQGRSRFADLESTLNAAAEALARAKARCDEVDGDLTTHRRAAREVQRLEAFRAQQKEKVSDIEARMQSVDVLRARRDERKAALARAREGLAAALDDQRQRSELLERVASGERNLGTVAGTAALGRELADLRERHATAVEAMRTAEGAQRLAREALAHAHDDAAHRRAVATLEDDERRLAQLATLRDDIRTVSAALASDRVTDEALAALRDAHAAQALAHGRRDAAASALTIEAERDLELTIGDESESLDKGATRQATIAARTQLRIPGVAGMTIEPAESTVELQRAYDDAAQAFRTLAERYGVGDLAGAVAANQRRTESLRRLDRLEARRDALLRGADDEKLAASITERRAEAQAYLRQRQRDEALPADVAAAEAAVATAAEVQRRADADLASARGVADARQMEAQALDDRYRAAREEALRRETALKARRQQLDEARGREADAALDERAALASAAVTAIRSEIEQAESELEQQQAEVLASRLTNAREALARAERDLDAERRTRDTTSNMLERARADGRFEDLEHARRDDATAREAFAATKRRADAARRLYVTLKRHRDEARQAYVRPLKAAIEKLGALVFGADFAVSVDDDWTITARTLAGTTLPFEELSVGTREQLDILTRLAAAQIVARHGGVPLIIDDALGFSDASRLEKMSEAIAAAGRHCQIVILTRMPERFAQVGNARLVRFDGAD